VAGRRSGRRTRQDMGLECIGFGVSWLFRGEFHCTYFCIDKKSWDQRAFGYIIVHHVLVRLLYDMVCLYILTLNSAS
jgi:hypothetical protein